MVISRGESLAEMTGLLVRVGRLVREERWINFIIKFIHLRSSKHCLKSQYKIISSEREATAITIKRMIRKMQRNASNTVRRSPNKPSRCMSVSNITIENRSIYALNLRHLRALILLLIALQSL